MRPAIQLDSSGVNATLATDPYNSVRVNGSTAARSDFGALYQKRGGDSDRAQPNPLTTSLPSPCRESFEDALPCTQCESRSNSRKLKRTSCARARSAWG